MVQEIPAQLLTALSSRGVCTRAELMAMGASDVDLRRWTRNRRLQRPRPGYYCLPIESSGSPELDQRILTLRGAVAAGPDVHVSHRSAAMLWRLPVWGRSPEPEVTRRYGTANIPGVRVHRYGVLDPERVVLSGLPTTGLARTVIDVCRTTGPAAALATVDGAMRDHGLDPMAALALLETLGDINFRERTRLVLSWSDPGAENPFESFSRGQLLLEGVPAPVLQWWVGDGASRWFRPDKLWPGLGLIGEADGRGKYRRDSHPASEVDGDPLIREKERHEWFTDRDFEVLRYGPARIAQRPDEVAARWRVLAERQRRRGWRWPRGVWLVSPGPWPPLRAVIRDESARWSTPGAAPDAA